MPVLLELLGEPLRHDNFMLDKVPYVNGSVYVSRVLEVLGERGLVSGCFALAYGLEVTQSTRFEAPDLDLC